LFRHVHVQVNNSVSSNQFGSLDRERGRDLDNVRVLSFHYFPQRRITVIKSHCSYLSSNKQLLYGRPIPRTLDKSLCNCQTQRDHVWYQGNGLKGDALQVTLVIHVFAYPRFYHSVTRSINGSHGRSCRAWAVSCAHSFLWLMPLPCPLFGWRVSRFRHLPRKTGLNYELSRWG
jgi:hypothetical protein